VRSKLTSSQFFSLLHGTKQTLNERTKE